MLYFEYYLLGILLLPGVIFAAIAQYRVTSTFNKFKNVASESGKTAYEIARMFLDFAGLQDVQIIKVRGHLTDYYNHRKNMTNPHSIKYKLYSQDCLILFLKYKSNLMCFHP